MPNLRYRGFVSYSHVDSDCASWLHSKLEYFRIDRDLVGRITPMGPVPASLRPVFLDRHEFTAGHALAASTIQAIEQSAALVVICSPASTRSRYVNEEIRLFRWKQPARPVIPFIIGGKPGGGSEECFPPALRFEVTADGDVSDRPCELLGADVRSAGDGPQLAIAKVIAGLLGLGTDEVARRAQRAQTRRLVAQMVMLAIVLLLSAGGALALWHNHQKQQTLLEIEALVAKYSVADETERPWEGTKEKLTDAIGAIAKGASRDPRYREALELLKKGQPKEAVPLLKAVAEDAAKRVSRTKDEAASAFRHLGIIAGLADPKRARQALATALQYNPNDSEALYWRGYLLLLAGDLDAAERDFNRLLEIGSKEKSNRSIYRSHLRLGEIVLARGILQQALEHQKKALTIAMQLVADNSTNSELLMDLSVSYEKIGDVQKVLGKISETLASYNEALDIRDGLANEMRNDKVRQAALCVAHEKVGEGLEAKGNVVEALAHYNACFGIREGLLLQEPENARWRRSITISQERIGDALRAQGDRLGALKHYLASLETRKKLSQEDVGNMNWKRDVSVAEERIGDVLAAEGALGKAIGRFMTSLAIREQLVSTNAGNLGWQRDLSVSYNKIGDVLHVKGDLSGAKQKFTDALLIRQRLVIADPANAEWQVDLGASYARLAHVESALGHNSEAIRLLRLARSIVAPLAEGSKLRRWQELLRRVDGDIDALEGR